MDLKSIKIDCINPWLATEALFKRDQNNSHKIPQKSQQCKILRRQLCKLTGKTTRLLVQFSPQYR